MNEQTKKLSWIIAAVGGILILVMLGSILSNISSIETELERNRRDLDGILEMLEEEQTEPVGSEPEIQPTETQEETEPSQTQEIVPTQEETTRPPEETIPPTRSQEFM